MKLEKDDIGNYLAARCCEDGECLIWALACGGDGKTTPLGNINGSMRTVRRELAALLRGPRAIKGKVVLSRCGQELCVAPAHILVTDRKAASKHHAAHGRAPDYHDPARLAKIRATIRQTSGIAAHVETIKQRVAAGEPKRSVARDMGCSDSTIGNVVNKRRWASSLPGSSVFAWAGART